MALNGQVVGYVRVSSAGQHLDRQIVSVGEVDRLFTETASGAHGSDRPQLRALLAYVRDGDTVRVASIDRLARSVVDLEALVDELTGRGVTVEFVDRHLVFEPGREDGHAVFQRQVIAAVAQLERTILKERQREGIEAAKARGVYKGRRPALTPDQVAQVRARHAAGETMVALAAAYGCSRRVVFDAVHARGIYASVAGGKTPVFQAPASSRQESGRIASL
ncbi:recombinase family protein [Arsenicicoccus dermatophilus]|uniref:recombinase family protein n=1 Tax=Arsenicicoccus dermatophilus TaxID=1076331 RepID=UPI003916D138